MADADKSTTMQDRKIPEKPTGNDCPHPPIPDKGHYHILQEEFETVVKALKKGMSAELVQTGGEVMVDVLNSVSKIFGNGRPHGLCHW